MKKLIAFSMFAAFAAACQASVIEYWDFEDGVDGQTFAQGNTGVGFGSTGVNGSLMNGWDDNAGPSYTSVTSPNGGSLGMFSANQDGFVYNDGVNTLVGWTASDWTLELHVNFAETSGWETLVARMGANFGGNEGDLYFQRKGIDANELRINYLPSGATGVGDRIIVDGSTTLNANTWYGLAVVADSTAGSVSLYVDDGSGYALDGQLTGLTGDLGILSTTFDWAFFRDYWGGGNDTTTGTMDNVRFSDTALAAGELIPLVIPEPSVIALMGMGVLGLLLRRKFRN